MKNKFLKILIPLLIVGIIVATGITISYLLDVEKSENNAFSAGTLDLKTNDKDGVEAVWKTGNFAPGEEIEGELELKNDSSVPAESLLMEVEIE